MSEQVVRQTAGEHQERPGSPLVELASGVDMLIVSGRAVIAAEVVETLDYLRTIAAGLNAPQPFDVSGVEFGVAGHARGKYRFLLKHPFGDVSIASGSNLPGVRVQLRSEFLHTLGTEQALWWFVDRLEGWLGPIYWTVSRIDLHGDWQGWSPVVGDLERFVCRAKSRTAYDSNPEWTGFRFGERASGTIQARIYDKTAEIAKKGPSIWPEIWGERYVEGQRVVRVEFNSTERYSVSSVWTRPRKCSGRLAPCGHLGPNG